MKKIRNINPVGAVDVPLLGRVLEPGEVVEVDDKTAATLLKQPDNYEAVEARQEKKK